MPCLLLLTFLWWTAPAQAEFRCAGFQSPETPDRVAAKPARITAATTGTRQALLLFARFKGDPANPLPAWAGDLFDPDLPGSIAHFYDTMSFGRFQLRGQVGPRVYESAQPASAYLAGSPSEQGQFGRFVQEILGQADRDLDFTQFDNDGPDGTPNSGDDDGLVDAVFIVLERVPAHFLLSEATGISRLGFEDAFVTGDLGPGGQPLRILPQQGTIQQGRRFAEAVGAICHEYGHVLGLPDLYDLSYDQPAEDSAGVGAWCLMGWGASGWNGDDGPNSFCAWSLEQLGWLDPRDNRLREVRGDEELLARALRQGGTAFKIPLLPRAEGKPAEYLLLEQRTRSGSYYDRHLPGEGLLVWHIRPQPDQSDEGRKQVDLVCADGLYQDAGYPLGEVENQEQGRDNLDFWAHDEGYSQAHGGNLGDAADPFDGTRRTRFALDTNPSSNLQGLFPPAASRPLALRFETEGEAMKVRVAQPRWAGAIAGQVHWAGQIIVDGDLRVAPGGSLSIAPGTQVLLEGADRLQAGRDPRRVEVEIQGDLSFASQSSGAPPGLFQARHPGERWYGLVLAPTDSSLIAISHHSFALSDAERGVEFADGQTLRGIAGKAWIADDPGQGLAGNGDGKLSPGERFQVAVEIANYSLDAYPQVLLQIYWDTDLITGGNEGYRWTYALLGALYPGQRRRMLMPAFGVAAQARAGEQLKLSAAAFTGFWQGGETVWRDTLLAEVVLTYPEHTARYAAPDSPSYGNSMYLPLGKATPLQVRLEGDIERTELVIRALPPLAEATWELPLQVQGEEGGTKVLGASWQPPELGLYHGELRLHTPQGGVALSPADLYLWAAPAEGKWPVLAFIDEYDPKRLEARVAGLHEEAGRRGLRAFVVQSAPRDSVLYAALLPHYAARQDMVLWMGWGLDAGAQRVFRRFLEAGGRLGIVSASLLYDRELWELLSIQQIIPPKGGGGLKRFRSLSDPVLGYADDFTRLEISPPAKPLLVDDEGRPTGLYVEKGRGRLVYIASHMGLMYQFDPIYYVQTSLAYLQGGEQEVSLSLAGHEGERIAFLPARAAPQVRLAAGGEVAEAALLVRPVSGTDSLLEVPLQRLGKEGERQVFAGELKPLEVGHYQLLARLLDQAGHPLFSTASLQVVVPGGEGEVLLVMDKTISERGKARLASAVDSLVSQAGLSLALAAIEGTEDAAFYEALLAKPRVVLWLGQTLGRDSQEVFLRFLERGGRLLMASSQLPASGGGGEFLRAAAHVAGVGSRVDGQVRFAELAGDAATPFPLSYFPLELEAPAVPLLLGEAGQTAGVGAGDQRAIYLPFDLQRLTTALPGLLGKVLDLLLRPPEARLWAGAGTGQEYRLTVRPPAALPVRLRAPEEVIGAELLVCPDRRLEQLWVVPMERSPDTPSEWIASLTLEERDQYLLLARLRDAQGRVFLGPQSFQLDAVLFARPRPAVAFASADDSTLADIEKALAEQGLEADVVEDRFWDNGLYEEILEDYPGGLAILARDYLDSRGQAAFRRHAEDGGSLLISSFWLADFPQIEPFLEEVLRVGLGGNWTFGFLASGAAPGFESLYTPLVPRPGAVPVVWDLQQKTAGVKVDAGTYKAVYLSFDLQQLASPPRRLLLKAALEFLRPSVASLVEEGAGAKPLEFSLSPAYPNPFNPSTTLRFSLSQPGEAELSIYNLLGQKVAALVHGPQEAGAHTLVWDGRDDAGRELASGVYLYRLQAGAQVQTRKLLLLR
jgi:M6 family metalloprotease-like protein